MFFNVTFVLYIGILFITIFYLFFNKCWGAGARCLAFLEGAEAGKTPKNGSKEPVDHF